MSQDGRLEGKERAGQLRFLGEYKGYRQAHADIAYDRIDSRVVVGVGCCDHARSKFFDARASDLERAYEALARIH
jgi:hypothetical protein